ncbi:putative bifunctional diguanylate cyclase/phosphodiesterase [Paraburkholderia aromaticivorans]|uniref:Diguanylate cyclase n=1 Tax=Paraburkholderia aromaticivorans TaxID=2026199 RepID=A0A248VZY2_9BURK|nr:EAL domain-containing protein [Paraburkholderia aromaticivorans]ASW04413.1 diguanylate cyclase [Paraburkholderia aromaticivorans]
MKCPPVMTTEAERLKALSAYELGTEQPLPSLDPVVRIAARMFNMPVAAVNMIGSDQVFFAASVGLENGDVNMSRDASFCAHVITQGSVMVVPDATLDDRFHDNPLVTGQANVRFYAGVPLLSPDGHALGALCVIDNKPHHDFSSDDGERLGELAKMAADRLELRRVEMAMQQTAEPFRETDRNQSGALVQFDERHAVIAWDDAAAALYGYGPEEGFARSFDALVPERERDGVRDLVARAAAGLADDRLSMAANLHGLRKDGAEFELQLYLSRGRRNGSTIFNAFLTDQAALRREQDELHRLASTDSLTGLVNRTGFYRRVEQTLKNTSSLALLMIDLDAFKDINATLGHAIGDGILCEVARRLERITRQHDRVARIGGDEFTILLEDAGAAQANETASAVMSSISEPIIIAGQEMRVTACCGIAIAPLHALEAVQLIGNAGLALSRAKSLGRGKSVSFVSALRETAVANQLYSMELHRAVNDGEFVLFYQPQIRLADGTLAGAEALIRWLHPQHGLLSPAAFLPALESGPLAAAVGWWVLDEACAQAALWRRSGANDFRIGVNLFAAQIVTNGDLDSQVFSVLERHGLPPQALELEVTENIVLDRDDAVLDSLEKLRKRGVGIALDDFGTGYASPSVLKRCPVTRIKIDRSFVQGMLESERDASVVRATLHVARSFGMETIAEGVESEQQHEVLKSLGCEEGQGFLFGRPAPAPRFADAFGIELPTRHFAHS